MAENADEAPQHPCSALCTSSGSNSLLTAPIEAAYTAERAVQSHRGPGAGADRRRPCRRRTPFACFHFCLVETMAEDADELRAQLQAANALVEVERTRAEEERARADAAEARVLQLQAAEARVAELRAEIELLRQVKALLEVLLANQRRRKLPISCGLECSAGRTW